MENPCKKCLVLSMCSMHKYLGPWAAVVDLMNRCSLVNNYIRNDIERAMEIYSLHKRRIRNENHKKSNL